MIIRVRHSAGTWRVQGVDETSTIAELKAKIEAEHGVAAPTQQLSRDPGGANHRAIAPAAPVRLGRPSPIETGRASFNVHFRRAILVLGLTNSKPGNRAETEGNFQTPSLEIFSTRN